MIKKLLNFVKRDIQDMGLLGTLGFYVVILVIIPIAMPFILISSFNDWSTTWFKEN